MALKEIIARIFQPFVSKSLEGAWRPGPYLVNDGWIPATWGQYWNYWQMGYDPYPSGTSAMVEACVSAYSQTIAMCPGEHWRELDNNGREKVRTSALSRILLRPNTYQTPSDFQLNLVRALYLRGNAYALALRNDRFEIEELHWMHPDQSGADVAEDGSVFFHLGGNPVIDARIAEFGRPSDLLKFVPARDVLHVKLHGSRSPLVGETPLVAAALSISVANAALRNQILFAANQSRPSGILTTDAAPKTEQMKELRALWDEQAKGLNQGGIPILSNGLKFQPMNVSAKDQELAAMLKLSGNDIAAVFRVPLPIVGDTSGSGWNSTEALMNFWLATGLGFAINHVELAYDALFQIDRRAEYTEFSTRALLRSMFKERIEALARGVQGGIFSPNEARATEELKKVEFGDEPRVQQQMVPLSFAAEGPVPPVPGPAATPAEEPEEPEEDDDDEGGDEGDAEEAETVASVKRRINHELKRLAA